MENMIEKPLNKRELTLLDSMRKYVDLQPKKVIDIEAMAKFFKVGEVEIERIIASKEGQDLVEEVVNYQPERTSRGKVDLIINEENKPTNSLRVSEKAIDKKDEINSQFLAQIALDQVTYEDALQAHAQSHTIDKMKLFQLQQAKGELLRVVRMLDTFNLLQDKYREQIANNIDMFDLEELIQHNRISYEFIQQSMKIVDKFTNDDTLKVLIMDSGVQEESKHIKDIVTGEDTLMNQTARKEVRKSAERLIASFSSIADGVNNTETPTAPQNVKEAEIITPTKVDNKKETLKDISNLADDVPLFEQFKNKEDN